MVLLPCQFQIESDGKEHDYSLYERFSFKKHTDGTPKGNLGLIKGPSKSEEDFYEMRVRAGLKTRIAYNSGCNFGTKAFIPEAGQVYEFVFNITGMLCSLSGYRLIYHEGNQSYSKVPIEFLK